MTTSSAALAVFLLRVSLGVMWIAHAMLKLFVFTLPGTAKFFESVGFPGFLAYPVFAFELLGGLALILGIYARLENHGSGLRFGGRKALFHGVSTAGVAAADQAKRADQVVEHIELDHVGGPAH